MSTSLCPRGSRTQRLLQIVMEKTSAQNIRFWHRALKHFLTATSGTIMRLHSPWKRWWEWISSTGSIYVGSVLELHEAVSSNSPTSEILTLFSFQSNLIERPLEFMMEVNVVVRHGSGLAHPLDHSGRRMSTKELRGTPQSIEHFHWDANPV